MDRKRLNSVVLTNFYLQRIRKLNPVLNAVTPSIRRRWPRARAADRARRQGDDRPLLGIPIIIKDNINTSGMPTTAGSWSLDGSTPGDVALITQLKDAGAIILGKANLSEWANFRFLPVVERLERHRRPDQHAVCPRPKPCGSATRGGGHIGRRHSLCRGGGLETPGVVLRRRAIASRTKIECCSTPMRPYRMKARLPYGRPERKRQWTPIW